MLSDTLWLECGNSISYKNVCGNLQKGLQMGAELLRRRRLDLTASGSSSTSHARHPLHLWARVHTSSVLGGGHDSFLAHPGRAGGPVGGG